MQRGDFDGWNIGRCEIRNCSHHRFRRTQLMNVDKERDYCKFSAIFTPKRYFSRRLLLGDAMQSAAFLHELEAINTRHFSVWEYLADHADGTIVILRLAEGGH